MYILYLNLKCVELILNTAHYTKADKPHWEKERRRILKELLECQLENFSE